MSIHWHVIINRITCGSGWKKWQRFLRSNAISHELHHTHSIDEARETISALYRNDHRHFLLMGGDGTIHHGGNILLELSGDHSRELTVGVLPCGTGNDWIRTYGTPADRLATSLKEGYTAPWNVVQLTFADGRVRYAMNMAGGALDAAVVKGLRRASVKIPSFILYPFGLTKTLLKPHTWHGKIRWEGGSYEGPLLTIQAGFAHYCGGGMHVLPHARQDAPGLLIMKPKPLWKIFLQTPQIYNGKVIHQPEAIVSHFEDIEISHDGIAIPFEADGEFLGETPVKLRAVFGVMRRVV